MNAITEATSHVIGGAFFLAFLFGAVSQRTRFCTMGAISDVIAMGNWDRMRMWLFAMAIAIMGTNLLSFFNVIALPNSIYLSPQFTWLSHLLGGFLFGMGMTLSSGCGARTLVRLGAGNLKSLVVFIFLAISAYMTLKGLFGVMRVRYLDTVVIPLSSTQDLPSVIHFLTGGADRQTLQILIAGFIAFGLIYFVFSKRSFLTFDTILGGATVGLVVVAGWYVTGKWGYVAEHPSTLQEAFIATNSGRMESFSFVAPFAYLLELLMLWSDTSTIVTFGVAIVLGTLAGSFAYALVSRTFYIEGFRDAEDIINHIVGGILMGFGGITALGCTIGQGITGFSTLAVGSFLTLFAIIAGCVSAVYYQFWRITKKT